ncbi:MAG: peptidoglycan endopeptidase [Pseudomonadota bacterium]
MVNCKKSYTYGQWFSLKHLFPKPIRQFLILIPSLIVCMFVADTYGESTSLQDKKAIFQTKIPEIAERYIGVPFILGGDFKESGALDNSHLFCLIYHEAAKEAGLNFKGYMPMEDIIKNTSQIQKDELRNGDLIILNDGHAAMIYRVENQGIFFMIYASNRRKQIFSFNTRNVVFEVYWMKSLKGFFRLSDTLFTSAN